MKMFVAKAKKFITKHRDLYWNSKLLQVIYARSLLFRARKKRSKGKSIDAVSFFCTLGRRVDKDRISVKVAENECIKIINTLVKPKGRLVDIENNLFLEKFRTSAECNEIRRRYANTQTPEKVSLSGQLLLLKKYNPLTGEKGVVTMNGAHIFYQFLALFNMPLIAQNYFVVLEPVWAGAMDPVFFHFIGRNFPVIVQFRLETSFFEHLDTNLIPVKLGSCDWVDCTVFKPLPNVHKEYDLVMVANWAPWKGHWRLFKALTKIRHHNLKVALVGFPHGNSTKDDILTQIRKYKINHNITIFEAILPEKLNEVFNRSKANILLSQKEGANRCIFEAMMAGIPTILYKYNTTIDLETINSYTGKLADDVDLPSVILETITRHKEYSPREWALRNMGHLNATRKLNQLLKSLSDGNWTTDIVPHINMLDFKTKLSLHYTAEADRDMMEEGYNHLRSLLLE